MTKLSININEVAVLWNVREGNVPNVVKVASDCESFGTDGIMIHPRPDERHIRCSDVYDLYPLLRTEFNIEGHPSPEFTDLVLRVKSHQVTLVPDDLSQIVSSSGWDTRANSGFLTEVLNEFNGAGIHTSVLVTVDAEMIEYVAKAGAGCVKLCTKPYAVAYSKGPVVAAASLAEVTKVVRRLGVGLNAGYDLSLLNLGYFYKNIPWLDEVSASHVLINDALYPGLERTIQEYKNCLR